MLLMSNGIGSYVNIPPAHREYSCVHCNTNTIQRCLSVCACVFVCGGVRQRECVDTSVCATVCLGVCCKTESYVN